MDLAGVLKEAAAVSRDETSVHFTALKPVALSLNVCRLNDGAYVISALEGEQRMVFRFSDEQFREFAAGIAAIATQTTG